MFFAGFRHSVAEGGLALPDLTFKMEWGIFGAAPALFPKRSILRGCATPCTLKCLENAGTASHIPSRPVHVMGGSSSALNCGEKVDQETMTLIEAPCGRVRAACALQSWKGTRTMCEPVVRICSRQRQAFTREFRSVLVVNEGALRRHTPVTNGLRFLAD